MFPGKWRNAKEFHPEGQSAWLYPSLKHPPALCICSLSSINTEHTGKPSFLGTPEYLLLNQVGRLIVEDGLQALGVGRSFRVQAEV